MDVYSRRLFYNIIASFGIADIHLPKYQNVGEVANGPEEISHIKEEPFLYPIWRKSY